MIRENLAPLLIVNSASKTIVNFFTGLLKLPPLLFQTIITSLIKMSGNITKTMFITSASTVNVIIDSIIGVVAIE